MAEPCVLIVESEILVRSALGDYLRECGYRVLEAIDAAEARTFLDKRAPPIDVVLIDIDARGEGGGFTLAGWVRSNHPDVEVALAGTIAKAAEKASDICREGPAIRKPYNHQGVLDHIRQLIAARDRRKPTGPKG